MNSLIFGIGKGGKIVVGLLRMVGGLLHLFSFYQSISIFARNTIVDNLGLKLEINNKYLLISFKWKGKFKQQIASKTQD